MLRISCLPKHRPGHEGKYASRMRGKKGQGRKNRWRPVALFANIEKIEQWLGGGWLGVRKVCLSMGREDRFVDKETFLLSVERTA